MNERIKELASQAYGLCKTIDDEGQQVVLTDQWNEKFAELIVKECTDFLKDTLDDHFAAEALAEHFGVEE